LYVPGPVIEPASVLPLGAFMGHQHRMAKRDGPP